MIEGLNLETVSVGRFSVVILDPGGANEKLVVLQATKVTKGKDTTVDFKAQLECNLNDDSCSSGTIYTATHPDRPSGAPAVAGRLASPLNRFFPLARNLDALADALDAEQRKTEATQVRKMAQ